VSGVDSAEVRDLLARIDERVKAVQEDIREINQARRCTGHEVKIRTLERLVWGCLAGLAGLGARVLLQALR
jgi:hypothetical protein